MVIKGRLVVAADSPLAHGPPVPPNADYDAVEFSLFVFDDGFHLLETRGVPPNRVATLWRYGPYPQHPGIGDEKTAAVAVGDPHDR